MIRRSHISKFFTSLAAVTCFFLFAVQLHSQYFLPADPSTDAKDPGSLVARVVSSASLLRAEHLYKEETSALPSQVQIRREFYNPDQRLVLSDCILPSLRGPPSFIA